MSGISFYHFIHLKILSTVVSHLFGIRHVLEQSPKVLFHALIRCHGNNTIITKQNFQKSFHILQRWPFITRDAVYL